MKLFLLKHIIVRFLDGKLSPEEESKLLNRKSVVSRMKQQWDSQSGDISTFDQERVLRQIESKIIAPPLYRADAPSSPLWHRLLQASFLSRELDITCFISEQHPVMTPQKCWFVKR